MQGRLSELAELVGAKLEGDGECVIHSVNTLSDACSGDISFLSNERYQAELSQTRASAVILQQIHADKCPVKNKIICDNPYLAYALIARHLASDSSSVEPGIHDSAIIHSTAKIADTVSIGALVVIGENVSLSANVKIGPGSIIGDGCVIGADTSLAANVTVYSDVTIGQRCLIQSGAVIGGDGFGFANDDGQWIKIPQTGGVTIGNDVEVGVNTAIDRGAIKDTVIADGVKLDNLIQIAHNVSLGKNTAIAGGTAVAGSTVIGAGCTIGGCSGIVGHLEIADNIHISAMTKVTKSLSSSGLYTGNVPAMPHKTWARNMVRFKQLDDLAKKIKMLEKKLNDRD